jgi:hypothetical protein
MLHDSKDGMLAQIVERCPMRCRLEEVVGASPTHAYVMITHRK